MIGKSFSNLFSHVFRRRLGIFGELLQTAKFSAKKISLALLAIGTVLLGYALTLPRYKNDQLFMERYMSMSDGQSEEYWKLREEMLTSKFQLEDYGITLIAAAIALFLVTRTGKVRLEAPNTRAALVVLAIALPFLTVGGYVFDLSQGFFRGEFPRWADSMSIPLMGVPVLGAILLVWSLAHLIFLRRTYQPSTPLVQLLSFKSNWWLLFMSLLTGIFFIDSAVTGRYWYAIPAAFWIYFYMSLAASRRITLAPDSVSEADPSHEGPAGRLP